MLIAHRLRSPDQVGNKSGTDDEFFRNFASEIKRRQDLKVQRLGHIAVGIPAACAFCSGFAGGFDKDTVSIVPGAPLFDDFFGQFKGVTGQTVGKFSDLRLFVVPLPGILLILRRTDSGAAEDLKTVGQFKDNRLFCRRFAGERAVPGTDEVSGDPVLAVLKLNGKEIYSVFFLNRSGCRSGGYFFNAYVSEIRRPGGKGKGGIEGNQLSRFEFSGLESSPVFGPAGGAFVVVDGEVRSCS